MAKKSFSKFFVYLVLFLLLFLGMVRMVFSFSGKIVSLELGGLVFLILLTLIGFIGYKSWGERVLFFVFLLSIVNLLLVWYFLGSLQLLLLFFSLVGFLMALPKRKESSSDFYDDGLDDGEPKSEVFEEEQKVVSEVEYSPGKYVASKRGKVYHEPKCEWAKKISEGSRVWFKDKKEAKKEGYDAHSCVN